MTLRNKIDDAIHKEARAERRERAYEHEGVKEALEDCRQVFLLKIQSSTWDDQRARDISYAGLVAIQLMENSYLSFIADGKVNKHDRKEFERRLKG